MTFFHVLKDDFSTNLDFGVGLDDPKQVLLEHLVVEGAEVRPDDGVRLELAAVLAQGPFELGQRPVPGRLGHRPHGLHLVAGVAQRVLAAEDGGDVVVQTEHDLAHEHVLERRDGARVVDAVESCRPRSGRRLYP